MSGFVRTYEVDGVVWTCAVICAVRGPLIEWRDEVDLSDIDCPSCLEVIHP